MKSLIFSSVGTPLNFHPEYDAENHWRYTKPDRLYETYVCSYNDFIPEENTYDYYSKSTGWKWEIVYDFLKNFDCSKYEYIGFLDDDLVCDIQKINRAITIAKEGDLKLFQISLNEDSEKQHQITFNNSNYKYTVTNFVEGMSVFVHSSLIPMMLKFWNYHSVKSGWGFDVVLSPILKAKTGIIHEVSVHHVPKHNPYYDKTSAFKEMYYILDVIYPKFMKEQYNEECGPYLESQKIKELVIRVI